MSTDWFHHRDTFLLTAVGWTAMMSVMMAPTVAPWVAAVHRFGFAREESRRRVQRTVLFGAGYVAVWSLFGLVVALAQHLIAFPSTWNGPILVGAGLFQFTAMKRACLMHCRNPFSFLLSRWKDGPLSSFRLGLSHGAYCLGCCWALMVTSLAVGFMNLWWMAALAVMTCVEQATPWGARIRAPIGLALIALGLWQSLVGLTF